jgi:hypothetical protein
MGFKMSVVVSYWVPLKAMGNFIFQLKNSLNFPGGRYFTMKLVVGCWVAE